MAQVDWCAAVFPGVLVAKSHYAAGWHLAEGGVKVVLFYGVGSFDFTVWGWIA